MNSDHATAAVDVVNNINSKMSGICDVIDSRVEAMGNDESVFNDTTEKIQEAIDNLMAYKVELIGEMVKDPIIIASIMNGLTLIDGIVVGLDMIVKQKFQAE